MRKILKVFSSAIILFCPIVSGMHLADVYVPNPGGDRFTKKDIRELTDSDLKNIHSNPEFEASLLDILEKLQMTILAFQQKAQSPSDSSAICSGTMSAIHDYLIDEASPSKIPTVCSLIDDLIGEGVPTTNPDLLFFRGVILFNSEFFSKVPTSYLGILTEDIEITDYETFGLGLIRRAEQAGCSGATEYLRNI